MTISETDPLPCAEKMVFENKQQAQAVATTLKYQRGSKLKPYRCQHCGLWHLASHYDE